VHVIDGTARVVESPECRDNELRLGAFDERYDTRAATRRVSCLRATEILLVPEKQAAMDIKIRQVSHAVLHLAQLTGLVSHKAEPRAQESFR
jgi:hypothetical protein